MLKHTKERTTMKKRKLKAKEIENGVMITMDATYFYVLNKAIDKAFAFGMDTLSDDYLDLVDIKEEFNQVDVAI